jgi:uncharacterized protein (TIGR03435 family)
MLRIKCGRLLLLSAFPIFGQGQTPSPAFEAADVKVNKSGEIRMAVDFQPGGRFTASNVPLKILIALAWHVRPDAVTGGPSWLGSERFDIVAKASQTTPPEEIRLMLRTLLAERLRLELHSDQKVMPAYALVLGKGGSKLEHSDAALTTSQRCQPGAATPGQKQAVCEHMTMAVFADTLQELAPRDIDAPVVNQTGLPGAFAFKLTWTPASRTAPTDATDPAPGPTLSEALENQLGLKLESKKLPQPVIVIDRVERAPTEN